MLEFLLLFLCVCIYTRWIGVTQIIKLLQVDTKRACTRSQVGFFIKHLLFYTFTKVINAPLLEIYMWDFISNVRRCAAQVRLELLERYVWFIEWKRGRSRPHRWFLNKKLVKHQVNTQIAPIKPLQCINTHWIS